MEGKKETFGANLASMMFTYRLGGRAGRENIWLVVTSAFAMFSFGLHLWSQFTPYFIFRRKYEPALLKTGHEKVVELSPDCDRS